MPQRPRQESAWAMRTEFHPAVPWHRASSLAALPPSSPWAVRPPLEALADAAEDDWDLAATVLRRAAAIVAEHGRTQLHRLVYVSRAVWGAGDCEARAAAILSIAQRRNAQAGLTGALLHSAEWYGQVLEGGIAGIEATFGRIDRDFRHTEIRVLRFECIEAREFAGQAMAEAGLAPDAMMHAAALSHAQVSHFSNGAQHALDRAATEIIHVMHQHIASS